MSANVVKTVTATGVSWTDPCPGCGDGDKVPAGVDFRCEVCDAEWFEEDEE